ncbi:MAG TPA: MBL fold metallo-hydrolase [Mycobacteriales bacterium]|nr:MBL fold metallo-hydrolase [Mycobacteriales bacterium]
MRIIKYTHACVRIEHAGQVLVIDPGVWSEPEALAGADAILLTHEHADHVDPAKLAGLAAPIYAPADAKIPELTVTGLVAGAEFTAAGLDIRAVGGRHAFIHDGLPDCANLGYIVAGGIYHPGDSVHLPDRPIETLLVPAHAGWLKLTEALDLAAAVRARRTVPIHDGQINERGLGSVNYWLGLSAGAGYRYLAPGEALD